jgi:hypothetical protein
MSPERIARLVARWARLYTHGLPAAIAKRRIHEIRADVHYHIAHERAQGTADRQIALRIASRMIRGLAADAAWREHQAKLAASHPTTKQRNRRYRSALRVVLGVGLILSVPLVAMLFTDQVVWSLSDFVLAGALLATIGVMIELVINRTGNRLTAIVIAAVGVAAAVLGNADDAPGLVLLGILLILSAGAVGLRAVQARR